MEKKNYTQISNDLLYYKELPANAKAVYGLLASFAQRNPQRICKIGIRKIQELLKIGSAHTVSKLIQLLIQEGWLETLESSLGRCNTYFVPFNKKCNAFSNNDNGTDALIATPPLHSVQPININIEDNEDMEFMEWNLQRLNN
jgi:hypothetical protein